MDDTGGPSKPRGTWEACPGHKGCTARPGQWALPLPTAAQHGWRGQAHSAAGRRWLRAEYLEETPAAGQNETPSGRG